MMLWLGMRWRTFLLLVALTSKLACFGFFCGVAMFWKLLWYPNGLYLYEPFMELPVYYYCMSGSWSVLPYSAIAILFLLLNFASRSSVLSSFYW